MSSLFKTLEIRLKYPRQGTFSPELGPLSFQKQYRHSEMHPQTLLSTFSGVYPQTDILVLLEVGVYMKGIIPHQARYLAAPAVAWTPIDPET